MEKEAVIEELKSQYPTLTQSFDGEEKKLSKAEYEATIELWADMQLEKDAAVAVEAEKQATKTALLERLGITEEEARLLLS